MQTSDINARIKMAERRVPVDSYWRHREGNFYVVTGMSFDAEKEQCRVTYRQIDERLEDVHPIARDWSHLLSDFLRERDGVKRFERMEAMVRTDGTGKVKGEPVWSVAA